VSKLKVAVVTGGRSSERDISLISAAGVRDHLDRAKYDVVMVDSASNAELIKLAQDPPDVAFIAQHGLGDEDGAIQGFLQSLQIPFTGPGILASALAMDKARCKEFLEARGVLMPESVTLRKGEPFNIADMPKGQVVVKPNASGSSDGLSITQANLAGFGSAIDLAFEYDDTLLVEDYIQGTEITVGVLGNASPEVLPVVEIRPKKGVFDREAKYTQGATEKICPANLPDNITRHAQDIAAACHTALGCAGMSRTDLIVCDGPQPEVFMIEINTIPGLTPTSLLPLAAQRAGYSYSVLLDKIIGYAMEGADS
jgi:D-alanine-D-alanine ligase